MFSVSAEVVYFLKNISLAHVCTPVNMETQYFQLLKSCTYWCHLTCWNLNSQSRCWSKRLHNVTVYLSSYHSTLEAMFHWHHLGTQCVNPPLFHYSKMIYLCAWVLLGKNWTPEKMEPIPLTDRTTRRIRPAASGTAMPSWSTLSRPRNSDQTKRGQRLV